MNNVMTKLATIDENKRISGYAPLEDNPITDTDSYKPSHGVQYVPGMQPASAVQLVVQSGLAPLHA